jgi:hypothetical protein
MSEGAGTSGGWRAMNGAQRRLALSFAAGFALILTLVMIANAESSLSDLAASGVHIPAHLVWSWEWSSVLAWLSMTPVIWWAVARLRPPRMRGWVYGVALVLGSFVASAWHVLLMVAIRRGYYAAVGAGPYRFFNVIDNRVLYEYRKDVTTYVQFVILAVLGQWMIARAASAELPDSGATTLAVSDGTVTHHIPVDEIERVQAAGNYVEIDWAGRTVLHRATLTAVETELGERFVRVHRSVLVRRDAVRRVETDKSGDFKLTLASGAKVRGSRRYRGGLD